MSILMLISVLPKGRYCIILPINVGSIIGLLYLARLEGYYTLEKERLIDADIQRVFEAF